MTSPLQYSPWTSDIELAFYTSLASLKINHDRLDSSARKVLGLYEIQHRDPPERSARMQIHGSALTTDESPQNFYRAEGSIRNFNTIEEFRQIDRAAFVERAGRTVWDAITDGTIYSCPSLLASFAAVCFADLKKYRFTYHFAYPAIHSDPQWRLVGDVETGIGQLGVRETTALVDAVQTWKYSVDTRQHGFFLAKRVHKSLLDQREEEGEADGNLRPKTPSIDGLGMLWSVGSLASYENGFFGNAENQDRFVCFADPSTYASNPGWQLRNLLVLVRQRWHLDEVQILCYRDTHLRREHPSSLVLQLQSATPVFKSDQPPRPRPVPDMPTSSSQGLALGEVDQSGEPILRKPDAQPKIESEQPVPEPEKRPSQMFELPKVTGWERNEQNKIISRTVDLAAYLDPARLADQAVDLNLKLIKWRISPSIDLDAIKHTSCLLLGAGTLGSYVARNLMGWGVRKISFVDNARVSYSNPVRQPLYAFRDCLDGGARKAERAAEALREIYPGIDAEGHVFSVPMAGHPIMDEERVQGEYERLKTLIETHDAIFLLMDTRESRWLPTVMAKAAGKLVINAALGFDTYVVMRHGVRAPPNPTEPAQAPMPIHPQIASSLAATATATDPTPPSPADTGEEVGCYFCSDVVAPADSLSAATLDQQCTVTRPGIAPLAAALAVELLVSTTQHALRARAPPPPPAPATGGANQVLPAPPTDPSLPHAHPLGTVPHQLRGFLSTWQTLAVAGRAYDCCAACSPPILAAYEEGGWGFVRRAVGERGFVERVSGLDEVQRRAEEVELEWDDGGGEGELL